MSEESHLRHWKSELSELKDNLLNGEITSEQYYAKARPIERKIREAESR